MADEMEDAIGKAIADIKDEAKPKRDNAINLIEHNIAQVQRIIANLDGQRDQLETEIAERTTRLRHVRASLEAFGLAIERLRP